MIPRILGLMLISFSGLQVSAEEQEAIRNSPGNSEPLLKGPYLGQVPPGETAKAFAPGIISTEHFDAFGVFTPDLNEFYFVRDGGEYEEAVLIVYKNEGTHWEKSVVGPRVGEPFISPDSKRMYRSKHFMDRTDSGWSEVKPIEEPLNDIPVMRLSVSSQGTYFFDERTRIGTLRYSRLKDGRYEAPIELGEQFNTGLWTAHPFIAPDESYLIWDSERDDGQGGTDLYIAFRQEDDSWGPAMNLGDKINSPLDDAYGTVTPDGKYLFFYRDMGEGNLDIYWVDAKIINTLKHVQN